MSRFGNTGTFFYAPVADDFSGAFFVAYLGPTQMPQYPFETYTFTDRTTYRSKSGRTWMYENYNGDAHSFRWSMLDQETRDVLKTMYDSKPLVSFVSGTNVFGTFRMAENSWKDSEVAHELFDVAFTLEEAFP